MAKSTADYYRNNEPARKRRIEQQKRYQKTKKGKAIKNNANKLNRKLGTYGNGDGLDASHYKGSTTEGRTQQASENRKSRKKNRSKLHIT